MRNGPDQILTIIFSHDPALSTATPLSLTDYLILPGFVGVQLDRLLHAVFLQQPNVPEQRVRDPISSP
jgi:hypothetical protein